MDWLKQRFELARGGERNVPVMEGLRGFAVFLVFLVHYVAGIGPWSPEGTFADVLARQVHAIGNTGVDLFFVLSGYLVYGALLTRPQPFFRFFQRRVQRIYPTFIAVFAVYVALSFALKSESKIPPGAAAGGWYLLKNFLLLPGILPGKPLITVAWALSFEMFFYLVAPLLIVALQLRRWLPQYRIALFLVLTILCVAGYSWLGERVRLVMFLAGMVLHECMAGKMMRVPGSATAFAFLAVGFGVVLVPQDWLGFNLKLCALFAAFFVLYLTCFGRPEAGVARAFSWTPLRWLGNMSYSYFLIHGLTLKFAFSALERVLPHAVGGFATFFALLPVMFAITLLPAAVLFLVVERPFSLVPRRN